MICGNDNPLGWTSEGIKGDGSPSLEAHDPLVQVGGL